MPGTRWNKVDATIVECFRAWEESSETRHPWFEIVADIKTPSGHVDRVTSLAPARTWSGGVREEKGDAKWPRV